MIIRHAEKPGVYAGQKLAGVDLTGQHAGANGKKHLATLGWQRAGALVTLFSSPWGPKPGLEIPQYLYASNPSGASPEEEEEGIGPSQRPYETLLPLANKLGLDIESRFHKDGYDSMIADVLTKSGPVLIAWQHEDIPLLNKENQPGMAQSIISQTKTPLDPALGIPRHWPKDHKGVARYDLIWIFDLSTTDKKIVRFTLQPQLLLSSDEDL